MKNNVTYLSYKAYQLCMHIQTAREPPTHMSTSKTIIGGTAKPIYISAVIYES